MTYERKKTFTRKTCDCIEKMGGGKRTSRIASEFGNEFDASCFRPSESQGFQCPERIWFYEEGSSGEYKEDEENDIESCPLQKFHCSHQEIPFIRENEKISSFGQLIITTRENLYLFTSIPESSRIS
jgi:hypothetical protein